MNEKLKGCPFCGADAVLYEDICFGETDWFVSCDNDECGIDGIYDEDKEVVIRAWNKRIDEDD